MNKNSTWCSKVSDAVNCPKCKDKKVIKNGIHSKDKCLLFCR